MRKVLKLIRRNRQYIIAVLAAVVIATTLTSAMAYRAAEVVSESRTLYSLTQVTDLSYRVGVRPSVIYDNASWVGPGKPLYTRLVEYINITYSHWTQEVVGDLVSENGTYSVTMKVSSGKGWSKDIIIIPPTQYSGEFSGAVTLRMESLLKLIDKLEQETGLSSSTYTITVSVTTDSTMILRGVGEVSNKYTASAIAEIRLGEGRMSVKIEGERSEVSKDITSTKQNKLRVLGAEIPVTDLRRYSVIALATSMITLIAATTYPRRVGGASDRKYRDMIVDGKPRWVSTLPVVEVSKLSDLANLARNSGKPIIRDTQESGDITIRTYTLLDGGVIYVHKKVQPKQN